jgi:hypothetical protein
VSSALRIPPRYRSSLTLLRRFTDDQAGRLEAAFRTIPPRLTPERLAATLRDAVPDLPVDAGDLVDGLLSLVTLLPDDPTEERVTEVTRDLSQSPDLELEPTLRSRFAERAAEFMRLPTVMAAARAQCY